MAAIDRFPDDTLDVEVKLSRLTGYRLIGLVQALLQQAIDWASETPGAELDPDFERFALHRPTSPPSPNLKRFWSGEAALGA